MLPVSLLPTRRPVLSLMAMPETEFYDLYVGDGQGVRFDEPDIQVIDAFYDLVSERAYALMEDWQHREAVIDIVSCFAAIASDISFLDRTIAEVSKWMCGMGSRVSLQALGRVFETAELTAARCLDMLEDEDETDGDPFTNHQIALKAVMALSETCMLHLAFGDVWVCLSLLGDRVRVTVDLADQGEIDMGGHQWDGDEDTDVHPVSPPLVTV